MTNYKDEQIEKIKDFVIKIMNNDKDSKKLFNEFIRRECFNLQYQHAIKLYKKGHITIKESYYLMTSESYKNNVKIAFKKYYNLLENDPTKLYEELLNNKYFYI